MNKTKILVLAREVIAKIVPFKKQQSYRGANMANIGKNGQISPPITLLLFKLHQHNVPQKNTFFIYNWGLINKNIV